MNNRSAWLAIDMSHFRSFYAMPALNISKFDTYTITLHYPKT